jgi:hypothetical protein
MRKLLIILLILACNFSYAQEKRYRANIKATCYKVDDEWGDWEDEEIFDLIIIDTEQGTINIYGEDEESRFDLFRTYPKKVVDGDEIQEFMAVNESKLKCGVMFITSSEGHWILIIKFSDVQFMYLL